jgi:hypothetical protein
MLFQTRRGDPAIPKGKDEWKVQVSGMPGAWIHTARLPDGTFPEHPELDIIPVEPTRDEQAHLQEIYEILGLPPILGHAPFDEMDQRLILKIRGLSQ